MGIVSFINTHILGVQPKSTNPKNTGKGNFNKNRLELKGVKTRGKKIVCYCVDYGYNRGVNYINAKEFFEKYQNPYNMKAIKGSYNIFIPGTNQKVKIKTEIWPGQGNANSGILNSENTYCELVSDRNEDVRNLSGVAKTDLW